MASPLLDYAEAAEYLRTSYATLKKRVVTGQITHVRIGGRVFFKVEDLNAFIEASRVEAQLRAERKIAAAARSDVRRVGRAGGPNLSVIARTPR